MKFEKTSKKAAYETVVGNITAEEAQEEGLVIVENNAEGTAPVYGRYLDTVTGAALEVLRDEDKRKPVAVGGETAGNPATNDKGALLNPNDPVVHGTAEINPHEDGAPAPKPNNADLEVEGYDPFDQPKRGRPRKA